MLPVSNTAFFCCGIRLDDYLSRNPIVNDQYSKKFMSIEGVEIYKRFKNKKHANRNILSRHKIIDDIVKGIIKESKDTTFISIGSGLESRAYRMNGGRWVEIDEHRVIEYKESCLPKGDCSNPLNRIGVDFSTSELSDALLGIKNDGRVVFIIEGVFVYLGKSEIQNTLNVVKSHFTKNEVITDFINKDFIERYSRGFDKEINSLGAFYRPLKDPSLPFIENGYEIKDEISVTKNALDIARLNVFSKYFLQKLPDLVDGYKVALMQYDEVSHA